MSENILIVYSSTDGQTKKICDFIANICKEHKKNVHITNINNPDFNIIDYDKVVIASSIRYGKHDPKIIDIIEKNAKLIGGKKNAFISVNLVARKEDKNTPTTNPYLKTFLSNTIWEPNLIGLFPGVLNYKIYSFWDSLMIKLIMLSTGGPTSSKTNIEYTDWNKVADFANKIVRL